MKKLAVVLGTVAVATLTGCRDQDYDAKHGKQVQDEPKIIETTTTTVETTKVTTAEVKVEEPKCKCAPGTKHTTPCTCGASNCKCIVVPPPVEPETTTYIVQNGDYLAKISKKYNVTISSIKHLNNLKTDTIRAGQKLKLPGKIDVGVQTAPATTTVKTTTTKKTSFAPYTGATKEYVVKNGDTLGAVAYGNGLNIRQLKQLNNLTSDALKIGQKLKVPAEKVTKPATTVTTVAKTVETKTAPAKVEPPKPVEPAPTPDTPPTAEVAPTPAPTTPPPADTTPAPAPVATTTYVVQEGEDLTRLSIDFGVSTSVIREMNNLGENDTIKPGQVLKLPAETQQ